MPNRIARRIVIYISIAIALVSFVWYLVAKLGGHQAPVAVLVGIGYGVVFLFTLFMDTMGKEATKLRSNSARPNRPRPRPSGASGQQPVVPVALSHRGLQQPGMPGMETAGEADDEGPVLEAARPQDLSVLQSLVDDAVTEMLALEDRKPALDADGHVRDPDVITWIGDPQMRVWFIRWAGETVGCVAVSRGDEQCWQLELVYVVSAARRRHVASLGVERVIESVNESGHDAGVTHVRAEVDKHNMRARRFLAAFGFQLDRTVATTEDKEVWRYGQ